jgi:hemoglobin
MDAQIRKQISFMTMAFGGPSRYTGKDLRTAHAKLVAGGLHDAHFNAVTQHLQSTLDELGIDAATSSEVLGIIDTTRGDVLGR